MKGLIKQEFAPHLEILIQVWGGSRKFTFLTSSQVMLMLLVLDHTLRTSDPERFHKLLVFLKSFKAIISGTLHIIILSLKFAMHISNMKGSKKCQLPA